MTKNFFVFPRMVHVDTHDERSELHRTPSEISSFISRRSRENYRQEVTCLYVSTFVVRE